MGWQAVRGEIKQCVQGHRVCKGWRQDSSLISMVERHVCLLTY